MRTNDPKGRTMVLAIGGYLIVKLIVNAIAGGGFSVGGLILDIVLAAAMYTGLQYVNYGVSVVLAAAVLVHLKYNLTHLPESLLYLIEAALDIGCILLLIMHGNIKQHFTNKWSELGELFGGR
ncbi:MAG: hypothetical protein IJ874_02245 [Ruminococcus sp.]|nr:hypothetical protein [Ruminococcus sp.]